MNDKDCAERTLLLAPELDACARAACAVERAVEALETRDPSEGGRHPTHGLRTQEQDLRNAMRRYELARMVLDARCRELGLERGAALSERQAEAQARENEQARQRVAAGRRRTRGPVLVAQTAEQRIWGRGGVAGTLLANYGSDDDE
jgi:hypothetical protein